MVNGIYSNISLSDFSFFFKFLLLLYFTLQYCIGFAIHWLESIFLIFHCSVQFSRSVVSDSATPWNAARQASLSITISRSSLKLMSIESVMPSSHLILCCPLLLLPPIPPSLRVFSNESTLRMRWPKYWSFSFSIIPSKEHPGLISFRKEHITSSFVLLSQDCFGYSGFLGFHINLRIICSTSVKNAIDILIETVLNI